MGKGRESLTRLTPRVYNNLVEGPDTISNVEWKATYSDSIGQVSTVIWNDGHTLTMDARGLRFEGPQFDLFSPVPPAPPEKLAPEKLDPVIGL